MGFFSKKSYLVGYFLKDENEMDIPIYYYILSHDLERAVTLSKQWLEYHYNIMNKEPFFVRELPTGGSMEICELISHI